MKRIRAGVICSRNSWRVRYGRWNLPALWEYSLYMPWCVRSCWFDSFVPRLRKGKKSGVTLENETSSVARFLLFFSVSFFGRGTRYAVGCQSAFLVEQDLWCLLHCHQLWDAGCLLFQHLTFGRRIHVDAMRWSFWQKRKRQWKMQGGAQEDPPPKKSFFPNQALPRQTRFFLFWALTRIADLLL